MVRPSRRAFLKGIGIAGAVGVAGTNAIATTDGSATNSGRSAEGSGLGGIEDAAGTGPHPYAAPGWATGDELAGDPGEVVVAGETAFVATVESYDASSSRGEVAAYDVTDGSVKWVRSDGIGAAVHAPPTVVGDRVCVPTVPKADEAWGDVSTGGLFALDAASGETVWHKTEPLNWTGPVLAGDGVVYARTDDAVYALDPETGEERWRAAPWNATRIEGYALVEGSLLVAAGDTLYALAATNGSVSWTRSLPTDADPASLVATGDRCYLSQVDGVDDAADSVTDTVWALSVADGSVAWETAVAADVEGSEPNRLSAPVVADGVVYLSSDDAGGSVGSGVTEAVSAGSGRVGAVHALDAETGDERWQFATAAKLLSPPAVAEGTVYVGGNYPTVKSVASEVDAGFFEHGAEYVGSVFSQPVVYALDRSAGTAQWSFGIRHRGDVNALALTPVKNRLCVQVSNASHPPYGAAGSVQVLHSSDSKPGPAHTLVDDSPRGNRSSEKSASPTATITTDPENAAAIDFDANTTVTLHGSESTSPNGSIQRYRWNVDGDAEFERTGETIEITLGFCGTLELALTVTDEAGRTATDTIELATI